MSEEKYTDKYLFSMISGYNFYRIISQENNRITAVHFHSDIQVEIKIICADKTSVNLWKEYIFYPPNRNIFRWPIDIVCVKDTPFSEMGNLGLVFKTKALPKLEPLKKYVYNDELLDWRNEDVKTIIKNFLDAIIELNEKSYSFISFDVNRIYYNTKNKDLYFDYFVSTIKKNKNVENYMMLGNDIAVDFMAPWVSFDSIRFANSEMEKYSLAALLFRLMVGRMPYQGSMFSNRSLFMVEKSDYEEYHREMWNEYLTPPNVFIFNKEDNSNSIGLTLREQEFIKRWDLLDDEIKKMFCNTFSHDESKNHASKELYSATQWKKIIDKCFSNNAG